MSDELLARAVLAQILSSTADSIKGAALSAKLRRAYEMRAGKPMQLRNWGYGSFAEFLERHADIARVSRPNEPGDIEVQRASAGFSIAEPAASARSLPPRIWQAFTNPDPARRRFLHRRHGDVAHYLVSSDSAADERARLRVDSWGRDAVEIDPIPGDIQRSWMEEFVRTVNLEGPARNTVAKLLAADYTSENNFFFMAALGGKGHRWRGYRAGKVREWVESWATDRGVPNHVLEDSGIGRGVDDLSSDTFSLVSNSSPSYTIGSQERSSLIEFLAGLSDDELNRVMVPLSIVRAALGTRSAK